MRYDVNKIYNQYNEDILTHKIPSCEAIYLACKRHKDWYERDDIYFDYDDVDMKIRFISKLKHTTGEYNGQPYILLPWQQWIVANIYGWKYVDTTYRVITNALIMISRKNGKTALASALGLIGIIADNEPNAQVDIVANNAAQAKIAFDMCSAYSQSIDPNKMLFKIYKASVQMPYTKSSINVRCSESMGLDGYNSSVFIIDEFHAQKNWKLYNVMKSSQSMRRQPLAIVITTAGFLLTGYPCYEMRKTCIDILKGYKEDDSQFAAIYELDPDDDYTDKSCWLKCCPSLGEIVKIRTLRDEVKRAQNLPSLEVGIKTKTFNIFCHSKDVWLTDDYIKNAMQVVNNKDFSNEEAYMGVDLAAVSDLTCTSVLFPPNPDRKMHPDKFVWKNYIYLPEEALDKSMNAEIYKEFKRQNAINVTPGNVVDYDIVLEDQKDINDNVSLQTVAYDNWNATQWAINAEDAGLALQPYSQSLGNFNKPTKYFEILVKQGKVVIDTNACVRWAFSNVELKYDWNENVKPIKSGNDRTKKIDPVIAMLQALGAYLLTPGVDASIY